MGRWSDEGGETTRGVEALRDDRVAGFTLAIVGEHLSSVIALPASGQVTLGRDPACQVRLDNPSISRRHALLRLGETLELEDLGSKNGVMVRGRRLSKGERAAVEVGQAFELGSLTLLVQRSRLPAAAVRGATGERPFVLASPAMREVYELVKRVAPGDIHVLLLGETGVGKELVAEAVHQASRRAGRPLHKLNCAAIPETLLESELFGHERGAFTGAAEAKAGLFEASHEGTVFLDEVGELPLTIQAKLLRVLEDKSVTRVGSLKARPADVRFIAATNRDLESEAGAGRFRSDLFFRLNGVTVDIPPLRERVEEIAPLARAYLAAFAGRLGQPAPDLSAEALALLERYRWPGNVRELRNVIERAVLLCRGGRIEAEHLPQRRLEGLERPPAPAAAAIPRTATPSTGTLKAEVEAMERERILKALEECGGNQSRAAELLGISRRTLLTRLDEYGVPRPRKGR